MHLTTASAVSPLVSATGVLAHFGALSDAERSTCDAIAHMRRRWWASALAVLVLVAAELAASSAAGAPLQEAAGADYVARWGSYVLLLVAASEALRQTQRCENTRRASYARNAICASVASASLVMIATSTLALVRDLHAGRSLRRQPEAAAEGYKQVIALEIAWCLAQTPLLTLEPLKALLFVKTLASSWALSHCLSVSTFVLVFVLALLGVFQWWCTVATRKAQDMLSESRERLGRQADELVVQYRRAAEHNKKQNNMLRAFQEFMLVYCDAVVMLPKEGLCAELCSCDISTNDRALRTLLEERGLLNAVGPVDRDLLMRAVHGPGPRRQTVMVLLSGEPETMDGGVPLTVTTMPCSTFASGERLLLGLDLGGRILPNAGRCASGCGGLLPGAVVEVPHAPPSCPPRTRSSQSETSFFLSASAPQSESPTRAQPAPRGSADTEAARAYASAYVAHVASGVRVGMRLAAAEQAAAEQAAAELAAAELAAAEQAVAQQAQTACHTTSCPISPPPPSPDTEERHQQISRRRRRAQQLRFQVQHRSAAVPG